MFIGREKELRQLNAELSSWKRKTAVLVYGKRRVGKSTLLSEASKSFEGYFNRIANCSIAIAYGIGGNYDRVFVSGNPDYPNYDWYSEKDDITYFPDTGYSVLGSDASPINGYAVLSNYLVTLKGNGTDRQACIANDKKRPITVPCDTSLWR